GRRIGTDARQSEQLLLAVRERAAPHDLLGTSVEIAGARVVAESGPQPENVLDIGLRQCRYRRKGCQESQVVRDDRLDGGLRKHVPGPPPRGGTGGRAWRRPPRQNAVMTIEPGEKGRRVGRAMLRVLPKVLTSAGLRGEVGICVLVIPGE